jgi:hypothetical protein
MARSVTQGKNNILNIYLKNASQNAKLYLGLYTSPAYEPGSSAVLSDLVEPTVGEYARIALEPADWTVANGVATNLQKIFTANGAGWGNVYGYFITNVQSGTNGALIAVENFSNGPYNNPASDRILVTPQITVT